MKTSRKGLLFALTDGGFGEGDFDYGGAVETGSYSRVEMSHMVWKKSFTQQAQSLDFFGSIFYHCTSADSYGRPIIFREIQFVFFELWSASAYCRQANNRVLFNAVNFFTVVGTMEIER